MSYFYDDEDEEVNNPFIDNGPQEDEGSTEMPEQTDSGDQGSNGESKLDKVNDAKDKIQKGKDLAEKGKKGAQTAKKGADAAKAAKTGADAAKAAKAAGNAGKFAKFIAPLMPWIVYVIIAIAIIIAVAGLLMFILTMPGMMFNKIKGYAKGFGNYVINIVIGKANNVKPSQIAEVGEVLESKGYDLHANGFLSDQIKGSNGNYSLVYNPNGNIKYKDFWDTNQREIDEASLQVSSSGVLKDKDGVVYMESDYIKVYLISDNYIYMIRNNENNLRNIWHSILDGTFFSTLFNGNWGDGLINLYNEGGEIGIRGANLGLIDKIQNGFLKIFPGLGTAINIGIDRDTEQLIVTCYPKGIYGLKHKFMYSLSGWTGRYGMPLEFLLSLHLSSMQPDLAYDLVKKTDTEVQMVMHESDVDVEGGIQLSDGIYNSDELKDKKEEELQKLADEMNQKTQEAYASMPGTTDEERAARQAAVNAIEEEYEAQMNALAAEFDQYIKDAKKLNVKFKTKIPYIYKVYHHWFRDVYFSTHTDSDAGERKYIDTDDDFEGKTGERWTIYETVSDDPEIGEYSNGGLGTIQYQLWYYAKDSNGNQQYDGDTLVEKPLKSGGYWFTEEDVEKGEEQADGTLKVVAENGSTITLNPGEAGTLHKMAKDYDMDYVYYEDAEEDEDRLLSGNRNFWVAYREVKNDSSGWQKYDFDEKNDTDEGNSNNVLDVVNKDLLYFKVTYSSNVRQIEDGQRGQTNALTKRIFSINKYYQYDGTEERAIAIDTDRYKTNKTAYKNWLDNSSSNVINVPGKEDPRDINLLDTFSIDRDSLAAFNILTNMNTIDSDAIYHDFKELIVELNFFDKETLTKIEYETFEWPIPEEGSSGWPIRSYDKRENDYGTLMHSKTEYDIFVEQGIRDLLGAVGDFSEEGVDSGEPDGTVNGIDFINNTNLAGSQNAVGSINSDAFSVTSNTETTLVGNGNTIERTNESGDGYDHKVTVDGVEYTHYYQWKGSYAEKTFFGSGGVAKTIHEAGCGPTSTVNIATGYTDDVNPTKNIVGYHHGQTIGDCAKMFEEMTGVKAKTDFSESEFASAIHQAFSEGKPCIVLVRASKGGDTFWTKGGHFVALAGEDSSGTLYTLDPGSSKEERHVYKLGVEGIVKYSVALMIPEEAPNGVKKQDTVEPFKGYKGGEYVVSPVTGVVLQAGTHEKITNLETGKKEEVGFIKIRVLDEIDYKKIFGAAYPDNPFEEDEEKEGFKYFLDEYLETEVAGNILYIEGFSQELFNDSSGGNVSVNSSAPNCYDESGEIINRYTVKDYTDVFSKKAREKLQKEEKMRNSALSIVEEGGMVLVKEGTVIGTCYDDSETTKKILKQLRLENAGSDSSTVTSGDEEEDEELAKREITVRPGEADLSEEDIRKFGNGNYIRYVMRTAKDGTDNNVEKDSIIENVENYFELSSSRALIPQEYQPWEGDLEILAEIMFHEAGYGYLASKSEKFKNDQTEADFEMYCMGFSVVNKLLKQNEPWYGKLYTDTSVSPHANDEGWSPLAKVVTSKWYGPREKMEAYIAGTHGPCYTEKELKYAEYCLTWDCTNITKPYETKIGATAAADGYTATSAGTVIPRCMCQQGGYGDGASGQSNIILVGFWDHDNNDEFGIGDELWGVDRSMESLIK